MSEPIDQDDLGGAVDRPLMQRVVRRELLSLPTRDSSDPSSILQPIVELLEKAYEKLGRRRPVDCAFVLSHYPERDQPLSPGEKPSRHLRRQRAPKVFGCLHMVTPGLEWALSVDVDCSDLEALHDWLKARALDDRPIAMVRAKERELLWFPDGVRSDSQCQEFALGAVMKIGKREIEGVLTDFHDAKTREHRTGAKYWHDASARVPCKETETVIQEDLRLALEMRFAGIGWVDREKNYKGSKIDFAIFSRQSSGSFEASCALELKVFREFHYPETARAPTKCVPSTNLDALESGIEQAAVARDKMQHPDALAYVASFDMRVVDTDDILEAKAQLAAKHRVTCRRYYMESSAPNYRKGALGRARRKPSRPRSVAAADRGARK